MRTRYTIWDGTQRVLLDPDALFDELAEYLGRCDDVDEALDRLLREGSDAEGLELRGIDELLRQVRERIARLYDEFNLEHSLEQPWNDVDDIVGMEQEALEHQPTSPSSRERSAQLGRLSRVLEEALEQLERWTFADEDARRAFEELSERSDDIRRVDRFQRRFREQFQGPRDLDFEETLELMSRFEGLREIERALRERDFDSIDGQALEGLLGREFAGDVERSSQAMRALIEAGYVVRKGGRSVLTPKGARRLGQVALREILADLLADSSGRHDTRRAGASETMTEQVHPYAFGDPLHIDVAATLRAALLREAAGKTVVARDAAASQTAKAARSRGVAAAPRVRLAPQDLHVRETWRSTRTSTVLLLDMSWSMSWEGRFAAAKKVALAMETLMRTRFPRDYFGLVGFYTRAVELRPADLAEVTWNVGDPFTNLQDGLHLGAALLARHPAATQQLLVITDGQPTAYFSGGRLYCEWPMTVGGLSSRATVETLREVQEVTRRGIRINTFMLDDSPPLRAFVQKMTSINKGRAFYTTPDHLGRFLLVDYVARRRKVV
ncbi:MAG: hypothetical protein HY899_15850 [Deltaproteobacteria bacterium]|nr:hypothetical protein [Deltaproteobacteria bacterium]